MWTIVSAYVSNLRSSKIKYIGGNLFGFKRQVLALQKMVFELKHIDGEVLNLLGI